MPEPPAAAPVLKIHGIFRSGTNLAKALLAPRVDGVVSFHHGGHKHLPLPCIPGVTEHVSDPTVVCVKNPLANLVSLFEYAQRMQWRHFRCGRSWDEFLRTPLWIRMNGDPRWPAYRFAHPVDYWNAFYANALSLPPARTFVLRYEALLSDVDATLARFDAAFAALPRRAPDGPGASALPERIVAPGGDASAHATLDDRPFERREWYLERRWLERYDAEQLRWVVNRLDGRVLADAGYAPADVRRGARTGSTAGPTRA